MKKWWISERKDTLEKFVAGSARVAKLLNVVYACSAGKLIDQLHKRIVHYLTLRTDTSINFKN